MKLFKVAAGTRGFCYPAHRSHVVRTEQVFEREDVVLDPVILHNARHANRRWVADWPEIDGLAEILIEGSVERGGEVVFARRVAGRLHLLCVPQSAVEVLA